jgi:hypothetical protein
MQVDLAAAPGTLWPTAVTAGAVGMKGEGGEVEVAAVVGWG